MKSDLHISPIRFYAIPKYPTKADVRANPAILRAIPRRWHAKPAVYMALMLTLSTGMSGCAVTTTGSTKPEVSLAIPVFEHGIGRGSYGCVSVAPPVFLSEEEASQVIREVAETKGVHFSEAKSIKGDDFPATQIYLGMGTEIKPGTWSGTLELDGYDSKLDIGFEFVSQADVIKWTEKTDNWSSVEQYEMKGTAERLAKVLDNTAVFYDPGQDFDAYDFLHHDNQDPETYQKEYLAKQKEIMLDNLREQVRDFLAWLAAEGII